MFYFQSFVFRIGATDRHRKKEKIVLIISRYHEVQKNLCAAMRIWKEIEKRGTKGWQLVMGGYGPDEQMLMDYIKELQIENIKILGKVKIHCLIMRKHPYL